MDWQRTGLDLELIRTEPIGARRGAPAHPSHAGGCGSAAIVTRIMQLLWQWWSSSDSDAADSELFQNALFRVLD
jgi:hypothetical protein